MSVDLRTRADSKQLPVEARRFFRETLPPLLDAHQAHIEPGARELPLRDFCIETDAEPWTLAWRGDRVALREGRHGEARVLLTAEQLRDLLHDQSTPIALMSNKLLEMPEGGLPDILHWWLVLRAALDGRRIHARGDVRFGHAIRRSFAPDDSDAEMRAFLEEIGYLHIRGLFRADEMPVSARCAGRPTRPSPRSPATWGSDAAGDGGRTQLAISSPASVPSGVRVFDGVAAGARIRPPPSRAEAPARS